MELVGIKVVGIGDDEVFAPLRLVHEAVGLVHRLSLIHIFEPAQHIEIAFSEALVRVKR